MGLPPASTTYYLLPPEERYSQARSLVTPKEKDMRKEKESGPAHGISTRI